MLVIENISVSYKTRRDRIPVIRNLSLKIGRGEALAILGPSGCGKSTLVNTLAGILLPDSGAIAFIRDGDRQELSPVTHQIGVIPQNFGLLPWKTVRENCLLPLTIRKEPIAGERMQKIRQICESLDLTRLLDRYPKELSGGQAQRAAIARAFMSEPDLLLMDEPFSSLDAITREEARELFLSIWEKLRPTTVLVTHSIEEALYLGHRILVMGPCDGEILYEMRNSYFGKSDPDTVDYLVTRRLLSEKLKTGDKREKACE